MKLIIEVPDDTLAVNVAAICKRDGQYSINNQGYDVRELEKVLKDEEKEK